MHQLTINRNDPIPIYLQIYQRFCDAVHSGSVCPGDRVPSSRSLASELSVARGTVEEAYALLTAEGYMVRDGQRGSIISKQLINLPNHQLKQSELQKEPRMQADVTVGNIVPFQLGHPALDVFPRKLWSRITSSEARKFCDIDLKYPAPTGYYPLKENIARYLALSRGVHTSPHNIVVTYGYQGALDLVIQLILRAGDKVWLEEPGYFGTQEAILRSCARAIPVRVDKHGLSVEEGIVKAGNARLAIVSPSHHSPTNVTMSLPRRIALLAWAAKRRAWIIEDDYDGEFHYTGKLLPALKSLDTQDRVLYVGSFSKTLFPSLRLGYLVVPDDLIEKARSIVNYRDRGVATFQQKVVAQFMEDGHFFRHLKRMRTTYERRRTILTNSLNEVFSDQLNIPHHEGGMNLLAYLPEHIKDRQLVALAAKSNIAINALSATFLQETEQNALIFGFTNVQEKNCDKLCQQLGKALKPIFKK